MAPSRCATSEPRVSDVGNVLKYEDLRDVVLVGHSSSGAVITASLIAHRIESRTSCIWMPLCPNTINPCSISLRRTGGR